MPDLRLPPFALAEQDAEAVVTERDRFQALHFWATYGTPLFRRLLNAVSVANG